MFFLIDKKTQKSNQPVLITVFFDVPTNHPQMGGMQRMAARPDGSGPLKLKHP
jgi:spore maturation protein SpmA